MTPDDQLKQWVAGNPVHNTERDECCPDFSCCEPSLLADKDLRERFKRAFDEGNDEACMAILGGFLGASLSKAAELKDTKVYIAGQDGGEEH